MRTRRYRVSVLILSKQEQYFSETLPYHFRPTPCSHLPIDRTVHGSRAQPLARHGRWTENALPYAPHLHLAFRPVASGHWELFPLQHRKGTKNPSGAWFTLNNGSADSLYHRFLPGTTLDGTVRSPFQEWHHHDRSGDTASSLKLSKPTLNFEE